MSETTEDKAKIVAMFASIMTVLWKITAIVASLMVIPALAIWRGYVLQRLWVWFIDPFMPSEYHSPTVYTLIGAAMFVSFFIGGVNTSAFRRGKDGKMEYTGLGEWTTLAFGVFVPFVILCTGWVWHWLQWGQW